MLGLVYEELSASPDMRAEFEDLVERVRPMVKDSLFVNASPPASLRRALATFVRRWRIPNPDGVGVIEVWGSLADAVRARLPGEAPASGVVLKPIPRRMTMESLAAPLPEDARHVRFTSERRRAEPMHVFTIAPPGIEPFLFDPVTISRREMERRAEHAGEQLKREIVRQVDEITRSWKRQFPGWRPVPSRYRKPTEMRRIARQIARAMAGTPTSQIARDAEVSEDAVRKTLREWSRKLGIDLRA